MRHLSTKKKASSPPSSEVNSQKKASTKSCATSKDVKTQASFDRTSSPDPCSKSCSAPEDPHVASSSRPPPAELDGCKCSSTPCQNCRKPNGPLVDECQPSKANGPVDCKNTSESCRQTPLQHRLKPWTHTPDSAAASGLMNHIGVETVKKEPESTSEACAQKHCPISPVIWPKSSQQHYRNQTDLQVESMSSNEKPSYTSVDHSDTQPKGHQAQESIKLGSSSPTTGTSHTLQKVARFWGSFDIQLYLLLFHFLIG